MSIVLSRTKSRELVKFSSSVACFLVDFGTNDLVRHFIRRPQQLVEARLTHSRTLDNPERTRDPRLVEPVMAPFSSGHRNASQRSVFDAFLAYGSIYVQAALEIAGRSVRCVSCDGCLVEITIVGGVGGVGDEEERRCSESD
uniref:Uncharacterized protein n=1 Tax=Cannabis sativa TaxID=3483 RepID=A0A803NZ01_CANSA